MNVIYNHTRYYDMSGQMKPHGGITFAMEEITPELFNQITEDHVLEAKFGLAKCSHKDLYNKKVGRSIAKGRMVDTEFQVDSINQYVGRDDRDVKVIFLSSINEGINISLKQTMGHPFIILEVDVEG